MSYLSCLSIEGSENAVSLLVRQVFKENMQVADTLNSHADFLPTETCGILFASPQTVLGPARLLWSPKNWPSDGCRCVYFWVHPAIDRETRQLLDLSVQNVASSHSTSRCAVSLTLRVLTGQLCRLRLLGRQSHRLLGNILSPCADTEPNGDWSVWKHMQTEFHQASLVPDGTVMYLGNCADFRLNRPTLKLRNRNWVALDPTESSTSVQSLESSSDVTSSIRSQLRESYNKEASVTWGVMPRSGVHGDSIHKENQIGIDALLIRNGSASLLRDYPNSIGWDVVVCRSRFPVKDQTLLRGTLAARDLLIACVYRGAEVGGQRDLHRWATIGTRGRGQTEAFPQSLWPDTKAGRESEMAARENRLSRHNRLPVNLRPDYSLLCTSHPFHAPWDELLAENVSISHSLQGFSHTTPSVLRSAVFLHCVARPLLEGNSEVLNRLKNTSRFTLLCPYLLLVHVHCTFRGLPEPCAILYAPRDEKDLKRYRTPKDERETNILEVTSNRVVLGYVQEGGFDYSTGRGSGLGFISLAALIRAYTASRSNTLCHGFTEVLMKNPKSNCIRTVHLSIVPTSIP
ncbi:hypothetical protein FBUS_08055 [Fasciolopsis buskii]|uniref:Uncharacterized protein n=1 Tax=Fasciolopsis buskii TaxID=27845 RepID=A0A8E0RRC6_9TREM|nr:hypothetical protein FBUS_08055 [Fasciolopsis buski]